MFGRFSVNALLGLFGLGGLYLEFGGLVVYGRKYTVSMRRHFLCAIAPRKEKQGKIHQRVHGSDDADSAVKDKIVVIDDPVSSMDSAALFVVGALVRDMVAICNSDYTTKEREGDYIKQIFILTHNAFLHH